MNLGDLNKVWEIKTLKKAGQEDARKILERIAKQVQPIMRKHKWRVKLLSEFWYSFPLFLCLVAERTQENNSIYMFSLLVSFFFSILLGLFCVISKKESICSPNNPSLLGLNVGGGVHVKLRLRRANRDWDFIPFDQILDTMLHELCHNVHGPHNAIFYKLWDELRKECEDLMTKGIIGTAEGFDLPGRHLGGFSRQAPLSSLRQTALAAAEKRARLGSMLPSGPKRLGGDSSIMVALSPIQAAAMAAERRLQDDIWCGSESCEESGEGESSTSIPKQPLNMGESAGNSRLDNGINMSTSDAISRKRSRESSYNSLSHSFNGYPDSNFVDLTMGTSVSDYMLKHVSVSQKRVHQTDNKSLYQSLNGHPKSGSENLSNDTSTSGSTLNHDVTPKAEESTMWECVTCTLLNSPLAPICELCGTQKPKDFEYKYKIWSCKFCTLENSVKLEKCAACGQWRYSHGTPVATPAPNLGT